MDVKLPGIYRCEIFCLTGKNTDNSYELKWQWKDS